MTEFVTDEEQVERLKKWWTDNGSSVIAGLVIGIGGLLGWRYWVDYQSNVSSQASAHFVDMINAVENSNNELALAEAEIIISDYSSTAYSNLAVLTLAKVFVESEQYQKAADQLSSLIQSKPDRAIELLARKRLSVLQLQLGQLDDALVTLKVENVDRFAAAYDELEGDIMSAKGDIIAARDAYLRARLAQPSVANPEYLQQKIDDLGAPKALDS